MTALTLEVNHIGVLRCRHCEKRGRCGNEIAPPESEFIYLQIRAWVALKEPYLLASRSLSLLEK